MARSRYGAFSYGHSQLDTIVRYIMDQEKHNRRRSFRDEYLTLLRKFELEFKDFCDRRTLADRRPERLASFRSAIL